MDRLRLSRCASPTVLCAAHLRRTGSRVPAWCVIDGEPFCLPCVRGQPIEEFKRRPIKSQRRNTQNFTHPPAVKLPDTDQTKAPGPARHESETCNDRIPASHRLTALETKLLNALQGILLNETMMLAAIHRYK
jgi:hypothetical protein